MHLLSLTCNEFAAAVHKGWGKGMFHAAALYRHVFKQGNPDLAQLPNYRRPGYSSRNYRALLMSTLLILQICRSRKE